jgi:hypothetical protein
MLPPRHDSDVSAPVCGTESGSASPVLEIHGVAPTLACCSWMPSYHRATAPNRTVPSWRGSGAWLEPWPEPTIR